MFRIGKSFTFQAAHRLSGLSEGHKCGRLHGHSYTATVVLTRDELVEPGFVTDFGDLAPFQQFLDEHLDHQFLNEIVTVEPTSELLARYLAEWFIEHLEPHIPGRLVAVRVAETPTSWAEYEVPEQ
jgi:6-pyruvoyltetrahydropterin/6-carboxytetrahydropterin synthase